MNNKATIEFGFRSLWRIQAAELLLSFGKNIPVFHAWCVFWSFNPQEAIKRLLEPKITQAPCMLPKCPVCYQSALYVTKVPYMLPKRPVCYQSAL